MRYLIEELDFHGLFIAGDILVDLEYVVTEDAWNADRVYIQQADKTLKRVDDLPEFQWLLEPISDYLNSPDNLQLADRASEILYSRKEARIAGGWH